MKKNMIAAVFGIALVTCMIASSVSRVSADLGVESDTEAGAEFTVENQTEEVKSESDLSVEESEDTYVEETEEDTEQTVKADSVVEEELEEITGMKVTLENTLEMGVTSLEISTFAGETFSENLLLNDMVLNVGDSCTIGIPEAFQDQDLGMYNVRLTMSDGTVADIPCVPFLENVKGILYRQNDTVLIRIQDPRLEAEAEVISEAEMMQKEAETSQVMAEALVEEID